MRSLLEKRKDLEREQLERTCRLMNEAVLDCLVKGYEALISTVELPDGNDRHVMAATIHARADAIVTYNLKDFPAIILARHNLEAIHPDEFINYQIDIDEAAVVGAARACCERLKNPLKTGRDYLETLQSLSLPKTAAALKKFEEVISPIDPASDESSRAGATQGPGKVVPLRGRAAP
ncbi:MAG TPA: PIN domain-containing protein [Alphaproteobacteria bacterium]|nr:PIN domain-containing protein [Alphaproteobacteria bacterium]